MAQRLFLLALSCSFCFCHPGLKKISYRMEPGYDPATEFNRNANGFIYSETAMNQLHQIVDSLNLRFKSCDLHPKVYALDQATGHYLSGGTPGKLLQAALEQNKPFEEVLALAPGSEPVKNVLVVRQFDTRDDSQPKINFYSPYIRRNGDSYWRSLAQKPTAGNTSKAQQGRWIFNLEKDSWEGFYLTSDFQSAVFPEEYGRKIQYVDCLIDTNAQILLEQGAWKEYWYFEKTKTPAMDAFVDRTENYPAWPFPEDSIAWPDDPGYPAYKSVLDDWHQRNDRWLRDTFSLTAECAALREAALAEAEKERASNSRFEDALVKTGHAAKALELKRKRRIIGGCSQDTRPREHAQSIAELAAETVQWDIFLRAHLDIMNDRFDRMSDGSYAWGRRQTYIGEVEALGIQTIDLLLGICMHARDLPENHYFGSLGRVGRALVEYSRPDELEATLTTLIADRRLDDFNRLWMYNLYGEYVDYLPDDTARKTAAQRSLEAAGKSLPAYLAEKL